MAESENTRPERIIQLPKELLENCNGFSFDFGKQDFTSLRRDLFYLLDYVTPSENFQIGNSKKKKDMVKYILKYCVIFRT